MLVAIDGPAGAGKSTVARRVADALGFTHLDTGAMYRCVALADPERDPATLRIEQHGETILLDGEDVSAAIRTPEVAAQASVRAQEPAVRAAMVGLQRAVLAGGDFVAEGRDIGTVVAPDAEVKVFLDADPEERARRRELPLAVVLERDRRDVERAESPLRAAEDAVVLDTTGLDVDEVVARIVELVPAA